MSEIEIIQPQGDVDPDELQRLGTDPQGTGEHHDDTPADPQQTTTAETKPFDPQDPMSEGYTDPSAEF